MVGLALQRPVVYPVYPEGRLVEITDAVDLALGQKLRMRLFAKLAFEGHRDIAEVG